MTTLPWSILYSAVHQVYPVAQTVNMTTSLLVLYKGGAELGRPDQMSMYKSEYIHPRLYNLTQWND